MIITSSIRFAINMDNVLTFYVTRLPETICASEGQSAILFQMIDGTKFAFISLENALFPEREMNALYSKILDGLERDEKVLHVHNVRPVIYDTTINKLVDCIHR